MVEDGVAAKAADQDGQGEEEDESGAAEEGRPMLQGYGYEYRIRYVSDTRIRYFRKNTDTGIRLGYF